MELFLVMQANFMALSTLFAESPSDAAPFSPANIVVPVSWLIAVGIVLIAAIALSATARRSKRTAEKIAEGLYESELQHGRLLDSLSCGVFVAGLDGVITYANGAFCETFDSVPSAVIGKHLDEILRDNLLCKAETLLGENARLKNLSHTRSIVQSGQGDKRKYMEVDLEFIYNGQTPIAIRGLIQDVTESKRLEEKLKTQTATTIEKASLCNILKAKNEFLEEKHRRLKQANIRMDKKLAEVRRLHEIAEEMAITDSVTGLYNHRYFQERFAEELKKAEEHGKSLSVMMIDIDGFKDYNDAFGHMAGDEALRTVSNLLAASVRSTDIVARYGGEEFVILLLGADKAPAFKVAESIRARIEAHPFQYETQSNTDGLTVSIGVASYPTDGKTRKDLLYAADMACYRGKREGKNRVVEA